MMISISRLFTLLKVTILTLIVLASFVLSSLGWRHFVTQESTRVLVGAIILISIYVLMVFELVNKTLTALLGAAVSVAAYDCLIEYVTLEEILQWQDLETLSLLLGMMIIVSVLATTGLFDYLAIWSYKKANGHFWALLVIIGFLVGALSAVLDNVSTMLLISPTLIKLSELEHLDARFLLMIMVIISNLGGAATPVGDPPNLIIINDELTSVSLGITFGAFTAYATPCVFITICVLFVYLKLRYKSADESFRMVRRDNLEELEEVDDEIPSSQVSKNNLELGTFGLDLPTTCTGDRRQQQARRRLNDRELDQLMAKHSIKSQATLVQSLSVLVVVCALFFIQSLPNTHLTLGWVSLFGALALLVMSSSVEQPGRAETGSGNREMHAKGEDNNSGDEEDNFERAIRGIEWSTLIFFFGLFIVMEVMSKLGLIEFVGLKIIELIDLLPAGQARAIGAITIVLWASGFASALIDNVPFTSMMIKVLGTMMAHEHTRAPPTSAALTIKPLVFALAFGACYGGNGSLIGASANVVTAGVARRHGYPMSFVSFFKFAAPATLISLVIANIYLVVVFVFLQL